MVIFHPQRCNCSEKSSRCLDRSFLHPCHEKLYLKERMNEGLTRIEDRWTANEGVNERLGNVQRVCCSQQTDTRKYKNVLY